MKFQVPVVIAVLLLPSIFIGVIHRQLGPPVVEFVEVADVDYDYMLLKDGHWDRLGSLALRVIPQEKGYSLEVSKDRWRHWETLWETRKSIRHVVFWTQKKVVVSMEDGAFLGIVVATGVTNPFVADNEDPYNTRTFQKEGVHRFVVAPNGNLIWAQLRLETNQGGPKVTSAELSHEYTLHYWDLSKQKGTSLHAGTDVRLVSFDHQGTWYAELYGNIPDEVIHEKFGTYHSKDGVKWKKMNVPAPLFPLTNNRYLNVWKNSIALRDVDGKWALLGASHDSVPFAIKKILWVDTKGTIYIKKDGRLLRSVVSI